MIGLGTIALSCSGRLEREDNMTKSMTGYGRAEQCRDGRKLSLEIRSVNSRYFEFQLRAPQLLQRYEALWRKETGRVISRGKVELRAALRDESGESEAVRVDAGRARAYAAAYRELAGLLGEESPALSLVLPRQADIFLTEEADADKEAPEAFALETLRLCLEDYDKMRSREGAELARDLLDRVRSLEEMHARLAERAPLIPALYRERLLKRIEDLLGEQSEEYYNGQRVAAETAIFADKADVQEELTRLASHFAQFREILRENQPVGKKLDFLIQEMNRETNTIGSKCNDLLMTKLVLEMKTQVEQLREQIQNIE